MPSTEYRGPPNRLSISRPASVERTPQLVADIIVPGSKRSPSMVSISYMYQARVRTPCWQTVTAAQQHVLELLHRIQADMKISNRYEGGRRQVPMSYLYKVKQDSLTLATSNTAVGY